MLGVETAGHGDEGSRSTHNVTAAINDLIAGRNIEDAVNLIITRYHEQIKNYADQRIGPRRGIVGGAGDGDDVFSESAATLFGLLRANEDWVLKRAVDRKGLVGVMMHLARLRVSRMVADAKRKKAGEGNVVLEADIPEGMVSELGSWDEPDEGMRSAEVIDSDGRMLAWIEKRLRTSPQAQESSIRDLGDQYVSIFRYIFLEGKSKDDVKEMLGRDVRTVERRIEVIWDILELELGINRWRLDSRGRRPNPDAT